MITLLFDIDGTLIRSGGAGSVAMASALSEQFDVAGHTDGISFSGRTDLAITHDLFAKFGIPATPDNVSAFYNAYLAELQVALTKREGVVLPGVRKLLDELKQHPACSLGLLTGNMKDAAKIKLNHFELWEYFDFGGYGDATLHRSEVARDAVDSAQTSNVTIDRNRTWTIGDTPNDIHCARAEEIRVMGVATGQHSVDELAAHKPDALMADLEDVSRILLELGLILPE